MTNGLRELRRRKGWTHEKAAEETGVSKSQFIKLERGERTLKAAFIDRAASVFGVTRGAVMGGNGHDTYPIGLVKIRGIAAAGLWLEHDDVMQQELAQIPAVMTKYSDCEQFAVKISGPSMDLERIFDSDYVVCAPYWMARSTPTTGDLVIVERREGQKIERSCKRLKVVNGGYELWPRSSDARYKEPIRIPHAADPHTDDGIEVEVIGLIVGQFRPR